ncbi:unnamed protein product, partial [Clonostachys rosea]
ICAPACYQYYHLYRSGLATIFTNTESWCGKRLSEPMDMDALGVAATSFHLLQILLQLRTCLKHQPRKFMSWNEELFCLQRTITSVRESPKLHTQPVKTILESVVTKAEALKILLEQLSPAHEKKKFNIQKITNLLNAKSNESQILKYFADLERDKTTLVLAISIINSSDLDSSENISISSTESQKEDKPMSSSNLEELLASYLLGNIPSRQLTRTSPEQHQIQLMNSQQHDVRQPPEPTATQTVINPTSADSSDSQGNAAASMRNVMIGNTSVGNRSSLAISHPSGGMIVRNEFRGDERLDGIHEGRVVETFVANVQASDPMDIDDGVEVVEVVPEIQTPHGMPSEEAAPMELDGEH